MSFRPTTVRARITALASVVLLIGLMASAAGLIFVLERTLTANADETAHARLDDLVTLTRAGALPITLTTPNTGDFAVVLDRFGAAVAASANVAAAPPPLPAVTVVGEPMSFTVSELTVRGDNDDYRVWGERVVVGGEEFVIYVATNLGSVEAAVGALQRSLLVAGPILLVLLAAGTWIVVGRALRPVEAIRRQVARISTDAPGHRVPVPGTDEIGRLAATMNDMLERLELAAQRERGFAADAAHELQSPLAALRSHIEVNLAHPDRADWPDTAVEVLRQSQHMEQLVRDLLFLSRDEHLAAPGLIDLDDIVLTEVARLKATTSVRLDTAGVSAVPLWGSRGQLIRLIRNLLENAVRHARSVVTVSLGVDGERARLCVADDGPGVAPADRLRIFERFTRTDGDRSRAGGGTGLGLAIVKDIARRHGGDVSVSGGPGAVFTVILPLEQRQDLLNGSD